MWSDVSGEDNNLLILEYQKYFSILSWTNETVTIRINSLSVLWNFQEFWSPLNITNYLVATKRIYLHNIGVVHAFKVSDFLSSSYKK